MGSNLYVYINQAHARLCVVVVVVVVVARLPDARLFVVRLFNARQLTRRLIGARGRKHRLSRKHHGVNADHDAAVLEHRSCTSTKTERILPNDVRPLAF